MNINTSYSNPAYSKPTFKAHISHDTATKFDLSYMLDEQWDRPEYIDALLDDIEEVKSDDSVALDANWNNGIYSVINTRTGDSISFLKEDKPGRCNYYLLDDNGDIDTELKDCNCKRDTGKALYQTIFSEQGMKKLFGIKKKQETNAKYISPDRLTSKIDYSKIDSDIHKLEQDELKNKKKIETLNQQNKEILSHKEYLMSNRELMRVKFVQERFDAMEDNGIAGWFIKDGKGQRL